VLLTPYGDRAEKSPGNSGMKKLPFFVVLVMYAGSVVHWLIGLVPWAASGDASL
jgi:hypothetical protein